MTSFVEQMSVFPASASGLALALGDEIPILIDGMKVVFDQKVALFPVAVEDGERAEGGRR